MVGQLVLSPVKKKLLIFYLHISCKQRAADTCLMLVLVFCCCCFPCLSVYTVTQVTSKYSGQLKQQPTLDHTMKSPSG